MSFAEKLYKAIDKNDIEKGIELLNNPKFRPSKHQNWAIIKAAQKNRFEFVKLLLEDGRISPANYQNLAVRSSTKKNKKCFDLLIKDPRVNLGDHQNSGIHGVCAYGYIDLLPVFLNDKNVDPCSREQFAIKQAISNKRIDIIKVLLQDERIDPTNIKNNSNGYSSTISESLEIDDNNEIFKLLLKYKHKSEGLLAAFLKTIQTFNNEAFDLLFDLKSVNSKNFDYISVAVCSGNLYAVKKMADNIKFYNKNDDGLEKALFRNNLEMLDFVLTHPYFKKPEEVKNSIILASENKNIAFLKLLLDKYDIDYGLMQITIVTKIVNSNNFEALSIIRKSKYCDKYCDPKYLSEEIQNKLKKMLVLETIKGF
jgi:hypothetical protein